MLYRALASAVLIVPFVTRWAPLSQAFAIADVSVSVEVESNWAWFFGASALVGLRVEELTAWALVLSITVRVETVFAVLIVEVLVWIGDRSVVSANTLVSLGIVVSWEAVFASDFVAFKWDWNASASIFAPVGCYISAFLWSALAHAVVAIPFEASGASLGEADALVSVWVEVVSFLATLAEWKARARCQIPSFVSSAILSDTLAIARVLVPEAIGTSLAVWSACQSNSSAIHEGAFA